jgi:hypothetical protein
MAQQTLTSVCRPSNGRVRRSQDLHRILDRVCRPPDASDAQP